MVNREKVILMTHMAQYAEREGTRDAEIKQDFQVGDLLHNPLFFDHRIFCGGSF